ncbi:MAG: PLP-dependent aminotransferase family protein [Clostridia bacterium]|nr:PLP-dependent aminotransferase family protein [Clostridia bacterium]
MTQKKYYKLYSEIRTLILSGEYKAGDKLPSKRVMADKTGYSQITVATAYDILQSEGYITSLERSGYFVCKIDSFVGASNTEQKPFDKLSDVKVFADEDFEHSVWLKTVRKVVSDGDKRLFCKAPNEGCAVLRNAISDYLLRYRGMCANPKNIIIGSGSEQLYQSVVKILGRDKVFGIEKPCYAQIKAVYDSEGVKVRELSMGKNGIESAEIQKGGFDVLHVTPFNSYPSGITADVAKRYEYLAWAEKNSSYVVEDDFASEFFMPGHPIQSLYALDSRSSVIYINTFSKSLSPSMRVGYMILPDSLLDAYAKKQGIFSCSVPVLDQYVLAEFINSGNFERHLSRVRRKMK